MILATRSAVSALPTQYGEEQLSVSGGDNCPESIPSLSLLPNWRSMLVQGSPNPCVMLTTNFIPLRPLFLCTLDPMPFYFICLHLNPEHSLMAT